MGRESGVEAKEIVDRAAQAWRQGQWDLKEARAGRDLPRISPSWVAFCRKPRLGSAGCAGGNLA